MVRTLGLGVVVLTAALLASVLPGAGSPWAVAGSEIAPQVRVARLITTPPLAGPGGAPGRITLATPRAEFPDLEAYRQMKEAAGRGLDQDSLGNFGQADELPDAPGVLAHTINTSFVGLDRLTAASGRYIFYPPAPTLAASATKILEGANGALRLLLPTGVFFSGTDMTAFFGITAGTDAEKLLFDPKVFFDENALNKRFYIVAVQRETDPNDAHIYLAVSRNTDPTGFGATQWCRYSFSSRRNAGTAADSWGDFPTLGMSARWLAIATTHSTFSTNAFTYDVAWVLNKLTLANNTTTCPTLPKVYAFQPSPTAANPAFFGLSPVQAYTNPTAFAGTVDPLYLVNSVAASSNVYQLIRIRGATTPSMQIAAPAPGAFTYAMPPDARQQGTTLLLDTGSQRVTGTAGIGDAIYLTHGTSCNIAGGTPEACVRYVRILVSQNGAGAPVATVDAPEQLVFGAANVFRWMPSIAALTTGKVIVAFQTSSAAAFLGAAFTGKPLGAGAFETPAEIPSGTGTCPRTAFGSGGTIQRTGDYTAAFRDPANTSFWITGERATTIGGMRGCQWETRIAKVTPP